jgi:hypothetical protein
MHSGATLSLRQKDIISQVAQHLIHAFQMRFDQAGSLYRSNASGRYNVGQSASLAFYKYEDGKQTYSDPSTLSRLTQFRGPFNRATDWLSQDLRIKGSLLNQTPSPEMGHARNNIDAAIDLCSCYPGEHPVIQNIRTPNKPSTFLFDDNSLSQC